MNTYVALLRGINVGGKNILPMKELITVLEGLQLTNVRTYIQSGNAVFQSNPVIKKDISKDIGTAISQKYGFTPQVMVLSVQELENAVVSNPYPEGESDPKSLHFSFLESSPDNPDLKKLANIKSANERFKLIDTVFYLHAPDGIGRSKLAANAEKCLGVAWTARNWRTTRTILSMAMDLAT